MFKYKTKQKEVLNQRFQRIKEKRIKTAKEMKWPKLKLLVSFISSTIYSISVLLLLLLFFSFCEELFAASNHRSFSFFYKYSVAVSKTATKIILPTIINVYYVSVQFLQYILNTFFFFLFIMRNYLCMFPVILVLADSKRSWSQTAIFLSIE